MDTDGVPKIKKILKRIRFWFFFSVIFFVVFSVLVQIGFFNEKIIHYSRNEVVKEEVNTEPPVPKVPPLDRGDYDRRMKLLANIKENVPPPLTESNIKNTATGKSVNLETATKSKTQEIITPSLWPASVVYPNDGAILPFNRIVAYYGNLYSKNMGALGQYPENEMLERLMTEVKKWTDADPETPAIPALHYIVVTAQNSKGADGKYRARMPNSEVDKVVEMAEKVHGLVFLDFQVGLSKLQDELPFYEKYFKVPEVHLGIDPEFSMKTGARPGTVIGTYDANDVNYAAEYLAKIVKDNNLTPKILVVHRFTKNMLTNYKNIKPLPEVQIVMDMDGWGRAEKKINTYKLFIYKEPIQFAGFKLFYKNDTLDPKTILMNPEQVLKLTPRPIYIQYQ